MGFKSIQKKPPDKTDIVYKKISTKNNKLVPTNKSSKSTIQNQFKVVESKIVNLVKNKKIVLRLMQLIINMKVNLIRI